jgi:hypothetical protein
MASPVLRRPKVDTKPSPLLSYLDFDNSDHLRAVRLDRMRQVENIHRRQETRQYKQLVRALTAAIGQTGQAKKPRVTSSSTTRKTTKKK